MPAPLIDRRTVVVSGMALAALAGCAPRQSQDGSLLRVAMAGLPDSLDPAIGQLAAAALIYKQIHGPLTDYGPDGGLAPGLAERWTAEDGGRRWVFTLRDGLQWSDGTPLTSEDIIWSARRIVDPASTFASVGDFYAVTNARDVLTGSAAPQDLGVRALDARRVVFDLDTPLGFFPLLLREFYPFPRHAIAAHGPQWVAPENFVGCGPFVPVSGTALSLDLRPNTRAWNPGRADQVHIEAVEDPATRTRLFRAGDYDIAEAPLSTQISMLRRRLGDQVKTYDAPKISYLKINMGRSGTGNPALRQALDLATDRVFLAESLLAGTATPTRHVIPGLPFAPASIDDSREAARQLLANAGLIGDNAPSIQLRCLSGERERLAIALADDWGLIGIEVDILATPAADLYPAIDGGDYDVALAHFDRGLKADPNFMIEPFAPGGFADNTFWFGQPGDADDRFATLIQQARETVDDAARAEAYRSAEAVILEARTIIPLLHEKAFWLVGDRVEGLSERIQPMLWRSVNLIDE
tara:strand:+ start:432 stop:2006 length:1575 start_codon:yes stop_codon:yes gene_type:complete